MKAFISLVTVFTGASVFAEPSAPTAEQVAEWAAFSKPVRLSAEKVDRGDFFKWGDPIWIYGYSAKKETLFTYAIGLYKAGSLFGENRAEMERLIGEQIEKFKELAQKYPSQDSEEMAKHVRIETRPDGRKVYFTVIGFGPGGAGFGGFTTVGQYDLLLQQIVGFEHGTPQDQTLKNPAQPTKDLPDIFKELEKYIAEGK